MRINKYLAGCGLGSRRKCEELVLAGRICVDGKPVNTLSFDVDPNSTVFLDGEPILQKQFIYGMLFKPKGVVTTKSDEKGRKTVMDLLSAEYQHLNPVGRLDYDTEGLLLFTNDGNLANALAHPAMEVEKTYVVKVEGKVQESELAVLRAGVVIDGKRTLPCKAKVTHVEKDRTTLELKIREGRNRQIRKMMDAISKQIVLLKRVQYGPIALGGLSRGEFRLLRPQEIMALKTTAGVI